MQRSRKNSGLASCGAAAAPAAEERSGEQTNIIGGRSGRRSTSRCVGVSPCREPPHANSADVRGTRPASVSTSRSRSQARCYLRSSCCQCVITLSGGLPASIRCSATMRPLGATAKSATLMSIASTGRGASAENDGSVRTAALTTRWHQGSAGDAVGNEAIRRHPHGRVGHGRSACIQSQPLSASVSCRTTRRRPLGWTPEANQTRSKSRRNIPRNPR